MARVSKKVSAAQREAENAPHRIWKTAIYARLSDFDDVLRNTESLEVQISYIKEYINHRDDLMLLDVFADKRCTGMNFDRPEFERLLKALQERKIDCIVVKDFSRLGRNFVETGQYLEQVFPLFGVRFIAINDNYDSLNSQSRDGMLVPIKSMINEMYSKDLSQKIQSCFRSKEARGEIYTPVPFGYKRNQQNHLVLDEEVSDVVMRIFLWKKSGMKEREIAKKLSAQGIQTPFTRRCQLGYLKNTLRVKDPAWQTVFVTKVLENPIYTGTMVYNRIAYDETNRKIGRIHGKAGGWCRTAIRRLSAGNCLMKFPHCGKPSKRSRKNEKSGADSAERTIRTSSKAESFAKSAEKNWFVIGKVMVRCIFTVHLAIFQFQRKTSGTALTRSCASGWKNTVICRSWYGKALEKANSNQKK